MIKKFFWKNCTLISLLIFFFCFISCTNEHQGKKEIGNCLGDKYFDKELEGIFKDFDICHLNPIPFSEGEEVCYPYVKIKKVVDTIDLQIFYSESLIKDIELRKNENIWEAEKETVNQAFQGIPKAKNKIIVLNDSIILSIGKLFKMKDDYYPVSWYVKYEKKNNFLFRSRFNGTALVDHNLQDISIWDSLTYRNNSVQPYVESELKLYKNVFVDSGIQYPSKESQKVGTEVYYDKVTHDINSSSFFYYLFRWW